MTAFVVIVGIVVLCCVVSLLDSVRSSNATDSYLEMGGDMPAPDLEQAHVAGMADIANSPAPAATPSSSMPGNMISGFISSRDELAASDAPIPAPMMTPTIS